MATGYKAENIREYSYFNKETKLLDFAGMTSDLEVRKFNVQCIKFNPMSACKAYSARNDFCPSGAYMMYWVLYIKILRDLVKLPVHRKQL